MKTEKEILDMVKNCVDEAMELMAEGDTGPEYVMDALVEAYYMTAFARRIGLSSPVKYSFDMIDRTFDLYLALHPEQKARLPIGLIPPKLRANTVTVGSLLRFALQNIYHLEVSEASGIPCNEAVSRKMAEQMQPMDEAASIATVEMLIQNPDAFDEHGEAL